MAKKQSPSTLLWFIRRRAYIPVCDIRRRFELDGDDGSFLETDTGRRAYVALPGNTSAAIDKLRRQGKIGLEYSVEFDCLVVIGVYPMVPIRDPEGFMAARSPRPIRNDVENEVLSEEDIFEDEDELEEEVEPPGALAAGQ